MNTNLYNAMKIALRSQFYRYFGVSYCQNSKKLDDFSLYPSVRSLTPTHLMALLKQRQFDWRSVSVVAVSSYQKHCGKFVSS